jgi:hypothetical protein
MTMLRVLAKKKLAGLKGGYPVAISLVADMFHLKAK